MTSNDSDKAGAATRAAMLVVQLHQRLTAASNYVATAQLLLESTRGSRSREALKYLQQAVEQILCAGAIAHKLRRPEG